MANIPYKAILGAVIELMGGKVVIDRSTLNDHTYHMLNFSEGENTLTVEVVELVGPPSFNKTDYLQ